MDIQAGADLHLRLATVLMVELNIDVQMLT
jgi:hypothetical protein